MNETAKVIDIRTGTPFEAEAMAASDQACQDDVNRALVEMLEALLASAKSGQIRSMVGCGFSDTGDRFSVIADDYGQYYATLGALSLLRDEYVVGHNIALSMVMGQNNDGDGKQPS